MEKNQTGDDGSPDGKTAQRADPRRQVERLLATQQLTVVATQQAGRPYASLVAFVASDDLRHIAFLTSRATTKYRNLAEVPDVSLLIDSRTHSVDDFISGAAVTVLGRVADIGDKEGTALLEAFLVKHPCLESFARSPSTALCCVEVETYVFVTRFQEVVELKVREWSSSNP